jgi:hypothetical protein
MITLTTTTIAENKYVHFLTLRNQIEICKKVLEKLVTKVKSAFYQCFIDKDSCNKD